MLVFAAFTSTISLVEPSVAWLIENKQFSRRQAAVFVGTAIWITGIGTILSFSYWSDFKLFGKNIFESVDYLTANIMLPLGGLFIALFAGWIMSQNSSDEELDITPRFIYLIWRLLIRYIAPLGIIIIFLNMVGVINLTHA